MHNKVGMVTRIGLICTLLCLAQHSDAQNTAAVKTRPTVHVLLIGVSHYERPGDPTSRPDLNCDEDVQALAHAFKERFSISPSQITILKTKADTTHKAIVALFRRCLIDQTQPGDIVFFHFSGAGTRVSNPQKPELVEQALVPSDYVSRSDESNDIRFSEIAELLRTLKQKRPGSVVLSIDACNAGGLQAENQMRVQNSIQKTLGLGADGNHGFVILAAASKNQFAQEVQTPDGRVSGLFSYAFTQSLSAAGPQTTYRDLFEQTAAIMASKIDRATQTPEIQGDTDNVFLDTRRLPSEPYLPLQVSQDAQDKSSYFLQAGSLQNMSVGSCFALYPRGTKSFSQATPLAQAEVTEVHAATATLKLLPSYAEKVAAHQLMGARAVETQHRYTEQIKVDLHALVGQAAFPSLLEGIRRLPFVHEVQDPAEKADVLLGLQGNTLRLERADGTLLASIGLAQDPLATLTTALQSEIRWRFVRALAVARTGLSIAIEMRLVSVTVENRAREGQGKEPDGSPLHIKDEKSIARGADGILELPAGALVMIEVRSDRPAYVNILNLGSNGTLNPIWPHPSLALKDNFVSGGEARWQRLPFVLEIKEPYDLETLKAIATREPTDFSYLWNTPSLLQTPSVALNTNEGDRGDRSRQKASAKYCGPALSARLDWGVCAVAYRIVPTTNSLHILAVGTGARGNDSVGAGTTSADAQEVADSLEARGKPWYRRVLKHTLLGKDATRDAIQKAFEQIVAQAQPQDTFVFYYGGATGMGVETAGHTPELRLTPQPVAPGAAAAQAITARLLRTWTGRVPAQKQILLLDVCSPDRPFTAFMDEAMTEDPDFKDLIPRQVVLMGSVGQRPLPHSKYGPFAEAIVRGLSGEAAPLTIQDSGPIQIMASDLESYLSGKLLQLSERKLRLSSKFLGDDFPGDDFPIASAPVAQRRKPTSTLRTVSLADTPDEDTTEYVRHGKDYALLIGTKHYAHFNTLGNPLNDVHAVDTTLRTLYGFKTEVLEDPSRKEILDALLRYFKRKDFAPDDQLLIYVAGHGSYVEKLGGRIICRDSQEDVSDDDTVITYDRLRSAVNAIPCRHILLVLDVCYGGSVFETPRGPIGKAEEDITSSELLKTLMGKTTRLALTSGNKEYVPDGRGENSPFTYRFLEALATMQGKKGILRASSGLLQHVQTATTQPVWGYWGDNQPGSDFLFIAGPK